MAKNTKNALLSLLLPFPENWIKVGIFRELCLLHPALFPLLILLVLSSVGLGNVPGIEHDWGEHPRLVCTPIPADVDQGCFPSTEVAPGPSGNGHTNGHTSSHTNKHGNGQNFPSGSTQRGMSDEAKETILHLRESLVHQRETILDQRETIRELTAQLTQCEGFGWGVSGHHDDNHDRHHTSRHSSHNYDGDHFSNLYYPLNGHRSDHRGKTPYLGKHGFSPEDAGRTLQTLKERLDNLQTKNYSSTYSSTLKDLLQRKINALEEQLHQHYDGHHGNGNQENHSGHGHDEDSDESHHESHHDNHHDDHHNDHRYGPYYSHYYGPRYEQHSAHNNGNVEHHNQDRNDPRNNNDDDHHDNNHHNHHSKHHDEHHDHSNDHGHLPRNPPKPTGPRSRGAHSKLDTVLSHLYHRFPETGNHKKLKNPDAFQIKFPMHTNYMYCQINRTLLNEIFAFTLCLWLKGGSGPGIGTPFSYSVPGQANELVLIEWGNSPVELLVNDKAVTLPLSMRDNKWHHLCVTWSTRDGTWEAYQNGMKRGSGENLSPWHPIKPGGVFILGQEQDTLGGRFDVTQSFVGEMSDVQLWSRVLNSQEINNQASCSKHLTGDVIAWNESIIELHGGVTKYHFDPCQ